MATGTVRHKVSSSSLEGESSSASSSSSSSSSTSRIPIHLDQSKLQAIVFDIDGTLADSWKLGFDATLVVLQNNGLPTITEELYHECTKYSTPQRLARHAGLDPDTDDFDPIAFRQVGQRLATEFDDLYVGLVSTETAGFFPGIASLLETRIPASIKIGALTNACVAYARAVLRVNVSDGGPTGGGTPVDRRFQSVHGADTVPAAKPEPDGLLLVCRELGVAPPNAVYVGDSPSDAAAAHAAGMPSIGVTWGSHPEGSLRKAPFTHICSDVDELCRILNL